MPRLVRILADVDDPGDSRVFVGTAIVSTFSTGGVGELRRLAAKTVALTAVVEFISNAYTLPLPAELIIVPIVVVLVILASFADLRPEFANTRTPFKVLALLCLWERSHRRSFMSRSI